MAVGGGGGGGTRRRRQLTASGGGGDGGGGDGDGNYHSRRSNSGYFSSAAARGGARGDRGSVVQGPPPPWRARSLAEALEPVAIELRLRGSLQELGYPTADAFGAAVEDALLAGLADGSLEAGLEGACGAGAAGFVVEVTNGERRPRPRSSHPATSHQPSQATSHRPPAAAHGAPKGICCVCAGGGRAVCWCALTCLAFLFSLLSSFLELFVETCILPITPAPSLQSQ